jgi:hypothetical protein
LAKPTRLTHSGHRQRLTAQAALSALKRFLDSEFGIQHGIGTCKRDASPRFGCIEKDYPFPATWICHFDDFKLDAFVFHGRSSKRRHRKESVERVLLLRIDVRHDGCRCRCLPRQRSRSGQQVRHALAFSVRHLVHRKQLSKNTSNRRCDTCCNQTCHRR